MMGSTSILIVTAVVVFLGMVDKASSQSTVACVEICKTYLLKTSACMEGLRLGLGLGLGLGSRLRRV